MKKYFLLIIITLITLFTIPIMAKATPPKLDDVFTLNRNLNDIYTDWTVYEDYATSSIIYTPYHYSKYFYFELMKNPIWYIDVSLYDAGSYINSFDCSLDSNNYTIVYKDNEEHAIICKLPEDLNYINFIDGFSIYIEFGSPERNAYYMSHLYITSGDNLELLVNSDLKKSVQDMINGSYWTGTADTSKSYYEDGYKKAEDLLKPELQKKDDAIESIKRTHTEEIDRLNQMIENIEKGKITVVEVNEGFFKSLLVGIGGIFIIEIFPGVNVGTLAMIPIAFALFKWFLSLFGGGK